MKRRMNSLPEPAVLLAGFVLAIPFDVSIYQAVSCSSVAIVEAKGERHLHDLKRRARRTRSPLAKLAMRMRHPLPTRGPLRETVHSRSR